MDASNLDALARSLARESATRRSLVGGIAAISLAAFPITDASAKKKKRCKRKKRCGKGCCNGSSCFAKRVNDSDSEVLEFACCPGNSLCKSELPEWKDQCCYSDEICDPEWPVREPLTAEGVCCRQCASSCLRSSQECVNGVPQDLTTARLPRYRR